MKYVLLYEPGPARTSAAEHFPAHRERWTAYVERGALLMIGPFTDGDDGALAVFTTREAAQEFAEGDPFVLRGVVGAWRVREWREALVSEPEAGPGARP